MASNFIEATVEPEIPKDLITEEEIKTLEEEGFEKTIRIVDGFEYLYFTLDNYITSEDYVDVFRKVMGRSIDSEDHETFSEVVIKGAFYCSKKRPGEFGGYTERITPYLHQAGNTDTLLELMQDEKLAAWFKCDI